MNKPKKIAMTSRFNLNHQHGYEVAKHIPLKDGLNYICLSIPFPEAGGEVLIHGIVICEDEAYIESLTAFVAVHGFEVQSTINLDSIITNIKRKWKQQQHKQS